MTSLHEYESWLDTLDEKLFVRSGAVWIEFGSSTQILLAECTDISGLKAGAGVLRNILAQSNESLPRKYLIERFVRLAIEANKLAIKRDDVIQELKADWNIKDEFRDF
jgi:hypothetical protein